MYAAQKQRRNVDIILSMLLWRGSKKAFRPLHGIPKSVMLCTLKNVAIFNFFKIGPIIIIISTFAHVHFFKGDKFNKLQLPKQVYKPRSKSTITL